MSFHSLSHKNEKKNIADVEFGKLGIKWLTLQRNFKYQEW